MFTGFHRKIKSGILAWWLTGSQLKYTGSADEGSTPSLA